MKVSCWIRRGKWMTDYSKMPMYMDAYVPLPVEVVLFRIAHQLVCLSVARFGDALTR